jgi:hypothetical protein
MALSRIRKGMIADGAVTPENLDPTADFEFNKVITPEIGVSGTSGLRIDTLRASTSSWVAFYNPTTKEITYGPSDSAGGGGTSYDQTLNTTDRVRFAGISSTTATITSATITAGFVNSLRINNAYNLPTADGAANQILGTNGAGQLSFRSAPNQGLFTTSSVTFANLNLTGGTLSGTTATLSGGLSIGGNVRITGSNGLVLDDLRSSTSTYVAYYNPTTHELSYGFNTYNTGNPFNQNLNSFNSPTFDGVTINGTIQAPSELARIGNIETSIIEGPTTGSPVFIIPGNGVNDTKFAATFGGKIEVRGDILPRTDTTKVYNLGSTSSRWANIYANTLTIGLRTIYFESDDGTVSNGLSIGTGTISINDITVVDQSVAAGASPVFNDTTITNSLTINDYTMPPAIASTAGYAMVSGASGQIEFQQAVLSSNISIDGGFSTSVYTIDDFRVDGGGAFA